MRVRLPSRSVVARLRSRWREICAETVKLGCSPWRSLVIFDVGANDGSTFLPLARIMPWAQVYAFEPTPELVVSLRQRTASLRNYHLIPKAVGENPGRAIFNVAGTSDWGCSSFLEFSNSLDKTWPGRKDFKVTEKIEVEIIRLDDFVRERKLPGIDFLHIDTQGTDLSVLRSLGTELSRVRGGVIEVPQSREVMLYQGQHTREEAISFLDARGFEIWKTVAQQNEDNIYFRRKAIGRVSISQSNTP